MSDREGRQNQHSGKNREVVSRSLELGEMHFATENYTVASEYFRDALDGTEGGAVERRFHLLLRLSDCARRKGDAGDAQKYLDAAAAVDAELSNEDNARIEFRSAHLLLLRGEYGEAMDLGRRAYDRLRHTGEHGAVGRIETLLGNCHLRLGHQDEAEQHFADALASFRRGEDEIGIAYAMNNLGLLHKNACRWKRSLEYLEKSKEIATRLGLSQHLHLVLNNIGIVLGKMHRYPEAIEAHTESVTRAERFGDQIYVTRSLLMLGRTFAAAGFLDDAHKNLHRARAKAFQFGYARECALADEYIGEALIASGDHREALGRLNDALDRARADTPGGDVVAECLRRIADAQYHVGQVEAALASVDEGVELARRCGETYELGYFYRIRGLCHLRNGDVRQGIAALETSIRTFDARRNPLERARTERIVARVHVMGGDAGALHRAEERLVSAERGFRETGDVRGRFEALIALAAVRRRRGDLDATMAAVRDAGEVARNARDERLLRMARLARLRVERSAESAAERVRSRFAVLGAQTPLTRGSMTRELRESLRLLLPRLGSERGFVVVRSQGGDGWEVASRVGIPRERALRAAEWFAAVQNDAAPTLKLVALDDAGEGESLAEVLSLSSGQVVFQKLGGAGRCLGLLCALLDSERAGGSQEALQLLAAYASVLTPALEGVAAAPGDDSEAEDDAFGHIVTNNARMLGLFRLVEQVAPADATVLLQGETGTGKGLFARAIHELSPRRDRRFIHVNCAAMPETLLESELFGHVRGAFTGAVVDKDGLLHQADGGTIFLDEIGKTSVTMQGKLLHFLDTSEVRRVGSNEYTRVDVRVICASKTNLLEMADRGAFLEDLFYRINDFPIEIPPLRERAEDIPILAHHYVKRLGAELSKRVSGISEAAMVVLTGYGWPGNVRELEKVIKRAVILCRDGGQVEDDHLPVTLSTTRVKARVGAAGGAATLKKLLEQVEKSEILKSLEAHRWNKSRAASQLGMSYQNLLYKIKRYDLG